MISAFKESPVTGTLVAISTIIALRIFLGLWMLPKNRETGIFKRLFWSFAVFVPLMGPFFYCAFYRIPKPHRDGGIPPSDGTFYGV